MTVEIKPGDHIRLQLGNSYRTRESKDVFWKGGTIVEIVHWDEGAANVVELRDQEGNVCPFSPSTLRLSVALGNWQLIPAGSDQPQENQEDHTGMVQNPYTGAWSWL